MKLSKFIYAVVVACAILSSCKNETKEEKAKTEIVATNPQKVSLAISGMTCEIGCAKLIQSKLSKKEGVLAAKVVFEDSIATVEFDANKTSKKDLIKLVDGIADGQLYKASDISK